MAIGALPVFPTLTFPVRLVFVVDEIVRVYIAYEDNVPSSATVSTVRAAPRLIFFPAEADTAPSTITSRKLYCAFVDEHSIHDAEARAFAKGVPMSPPRKDLECQPFLMFRARTGFRASE